jgi:hypothetical protein
VAIDGQSLTSAEAGLGWARVSLSAAGAHDAVELLLWPQSKFASAAPGSTLTLALGEEGSEDDVLSGEVTSVRASPDGLWVEGLSKTVALSRERRSQTYESQSVADIVNDLASSVGTDEVQGDTQLDAYSVDDRRPVWSHLLDLAALVGADVGSSSAGELRFVPPRTGSPDFTLRYGADVLRWQAGAANQPNVPGVAAYGAASEQGADKWHWITRSPTAAGSSSSPLRVVPALRTRDGASTMAQALADRAGRASVQGTLLLGGRGDLRPGALVDVQDLPSGDPGTLRVLRIEHVIDGARGFFTTLAVESAGDGGGGGFP